MHKRFRGSGIALPLWSALEKEHSRRVFILNPFGRGSLVQVLLHVHILLILVSVNAVRDTV